MLTVQNAPRLTESEKALLEQIACEIAAVKGRRYKTLQEKFDDEILTDAEYAEYLVLVDKIEALGVKRLESIAEMAERRNIRLVEFLKQTGLNSPSHA